MKLARFSLYVLAVVFLGLGAMSLSAPTNLTALVEIAMPTRIAVMEVRGVYGGFFFGTGFFLLLFAPPPGMVSTGLIAQASIIWGGRPGSDGRHCSWRSSQSFHRYTLCRRDSRVGRCFGFAPPSYLTTQEPNLCQTSFHQL